LLYTVKKGLAIFPSPAGMSLAKLFLTGNTVIKLFPAREGLFSDIPAVDGKIANLFTVYSFLRSPDKMWSPNKILESSEYAVSPTVTYEYLRSTPTYTLFHHKWTNGQIISPWPGDKVDFGIGLRSSLA
jgi:hypothetical protein